MTTPSASTSLFSRLHHAVISNPPQIVPRDVIDREAYRARYTSVPKRGSFTAGAPFTERLFELAAPEGFIAEIASNQFTKRDFGRPLCAEVLPRRDVTLWVDSSGAFIPGMGMPTMILAARNRPPAPAAQIPVVMGLRGEPETPANHIGYAWADILRALNLPIPKAPHGPGSGSPGGAHIANALRPVARDLARDIERSGKVSPYDAPSIAGSWVTTAAMTLAVPTVTEDATGEHLAQSFWRIARVLPCGEWFDASAGVNPAFKHLITDEWSARIRLAVKRAGVEKVLKANTTNGNNTDWMGDLYAALNVARREDHGLCEAPLMVSELLAELSVMPALHYFGSRATVCDPSCGTGHLLIESVRRLFEHRVKVHGGATARVRGSRRDCILSALDHVYGADRNPEAVAIARWRLMLAAVDAGGLRFDDVPRDLPVHVEVADALIEGRPEGRRKWLKGAVARADDDVSAYPLAKLETPYIVTGLRRLDQLCHVKTEGVEGGEAENDNGARRDPA